MTDETELREEELDRLARFYRARLLLILDADKTRGHEKEERQIIDSYLEDKPLTEGARR